MLDNVDAALESAISSHEAGDLIVAGEKYLEILKVDPSHPDANHNLGVLLVNSKKFEQAIPHFSKALEANPSILQFWLSLIDVLLKLKRYEVARSVIEKAEENEMEYF